MKLILLFKIFLTTSLLIFFTAFWMSPIIVMGLIKRMLPFSFTRCLCNRIANALLWGWCSSLLFTINMTNTVKWDIGNMPPLSKKKWYLLICNHLSWLDTVILNSALRNTIPMNKYFVKRSLIWVPFIGLACWALDMPFMRRYSTRYLLKHPLKRRKDLEATRRSCEKFKFQPTTVVNFIEGTRFSFEKHKKSQSRYKHLLSPKSAGIAYAINTLKERFDEIINVTLCYPENTESPFFDFLCGRLTKISIRLETLSITEELLGDYRQDKEYKHSFQQWLKQLWLAKDEQLNVIIQQLPNEQQKH